MKLSKTLVHSLREDPADVEMDSQKLLLKGGLIAKVDSGLYAFTPLGYRFLEDIQKVVENNSKKIGGSQISIPYVNNLEEVSEKNNGFILNSNEETLSFINFLKSSVTSYKQLPLFFYENNTEFSYKGKNNLGIMGGRQILREYFYMVLDGENDKFNKKELIKLYKKYL